MAKTELQTTQPTNGNQLETFNQNNTGIQLTSEDALDFQRALQAVSTGFDGFDKPTDILASGESFSIIDAYKVEDFVDKKTGELSDKFVFSLQMDSGVMKTIMQSDTNPRRQVATLFERAKLNGGKSKSKT